MTNTSTTSPALQSEAATTVDLLDNWFDAIEVGLRERVRDFIQAMIESELDTALARPRYGRRPKRDVQNGDGPKGISGHRSRSLMGTFGQVEIAVPRARLDSVAGKTTEWKSSALRAYQRRTKRADSLIAGAYLAGTNTLGIARCPPIPIDVHKEGIVVAVAEGGIRGEVREYGRIANTRYLAAAGSEANQGIAKARFHVPPLRSDSEHIIHCLLVVQHRLYGLVNPDSLLPAGVRLQFRAIAEDDRLIGGAEQCRVRR
jgi:hypothetical protein